MKMFRHASNIATRSGLDRPSQYTDVTTATCARLEHEARRVQTARRRFYFCGSSRLWLNFPCNMICRQSRIRRLGRRHGRCRSAPVVGQEAEAKGSAVSPQQAEHFANWVLPISSAIPDHVPARHCHRAQDSGGVAAGATRRVLPSPLTCVGSSIAVVRPCDLKGTGFVRRSLRS
jgi:hypothetical protein